MNGNYAAGNAKKGITGYYNHVSRNTMNANALGNDLPTSSVSTGDNYCGNAGGGGGQLC